MGNHPGHYAHRSAGTGEVISRKRRVHGDLRRRPNADISGNSGTEKWQGPDGRRQARGQRFSHPFPCTGCKPKEHEKRDASHLPAITGWKKTMNTHGTPNDGSKCHAVKMQMLCGPYNRIRLYMPVFLPACFLGIAPAAGAGGRNL